MTPDDILRMAREAAKGRTANNETEARSLYGVEEIARFAALVAAAEREECAKVCADTYFGNPGELNHELAAAIRARGKA